MASTISFKWVEWKEIVLCSTKKELVFPKKRRRRKSRLQNNVQYFNFYLRHSISKNYASTLVHTSFIHLGRETGLGWDIWPIYRRWIRSWVHGKTSSKSGLNPISCKKIWTVGSNYPPWMIIYLNITPIFIDGKNNKFQSPKEFSSQILEPKSTLNPTKF